MSETIINQQLPPLTWQLHKSMLLVSAFGKPMAQLISGMEDELTNKYIKPPECTGAYIYGNVGTGKTTMAARLSLAVYKDLLTDERIKPLNQRREKSITLRFLTLDDFPVKLQIAIEQKSFGKFMIDYFETDILIIDDIFSKNNENVNSIIKERYKNDMITIYTSNFTPEDAIKKVDSSIIRRIFEKCVVHECTKYYGAGKLKNVKSL